MSDQIKVNDLLPGMKDKIALVLPARDDGTGRSNDLKRFIASWRKQSEGLSDLFIIIDHDDLEPFKFLDNEPGIEVIVQTPEQSKNYLMQKINVAAVPLSYKYRYIAYAADDIILRTKWESLFIDTLKDKPLGMVYGNDMVHNGGLPTHPCVTSNFVRLLGYFGGPGECHHNYFDNFWGDISRNLNCNYYLPEVIMEHTHPITGKSEHNYMTERAIRTIEDDYFRYMKYAASDFAKEMNHISRSLNLGLQFNQTEKLKVIDCFPFFNEFLILDIRFQELYDVVDKFVIVESRETYTGEPKPLYLTECLSERYSKYMDKIKIIVVDKMDDVSSSSLGYQFIAPGTEQNWNRSAFQRNHINRESLSKIIDLKDNDIILCGDADEIPRANTIITLLSNPGMRGRFEHRYYHFKLNQQQERNWYQAVFLPYKEFTTLTDARYEFSEGVMFKDAGWHFSYLANAEAVQKKLRSIEHAELYRSEFDDLEYIKAHINSGKDMYSRDDHPVHKVRIDNSYPRYVRQNIGLLEEWIA